MLEIVLYICKTESEYVSFHSESEQKVRELEEIKINLEEEIREQKNRLKCE